MIPDHTLQCPLGREGKGPQQTSWEPPIGQGALQVRQASWWWRPEPRVPFLEGLLFLGEAAVRTLHADFQLCH